MNGFLLLNKPSGPSSHDVVKVVRKVARTRKVGHAGTLDPEASGLLTIALGSCTKLLQYLVLKDKSYDFELVLGRQTVTDDAVGEVVGESDYSHVTRESLQGCLSEFVGEGVEQVPPNISAVRIEGRRAHELTRRGVDFEMPTRQVDIYDLQLHDYDAERGVARMSIYCGTGTYVRALCRDIGLRLGTHAHAQKIRRTQVGIFTLEGAIDFEKLSELRRGELASSLLTDQQMLGLNLKVWVNDDLAWRLGMGQKVYVGMGPTFTPSQVTEYISILDDADELIGVGVAHRVDAKGLVLAPKKILKPRWGTERRATAPQQGSNHG